MNVRTLNRGFLSSLGLVWLGLFLAGCAGSPSAPTTISEPENYNYIIGPGDRLNVTVWHNQELSQILPVRPDGKISVPLASDMQAAGKTPTALAHDLEKVLSDFVKDPVVTVVVMEFVGPYDQQIRVIGQATKPQTLQYRQNMSLMDVMIAVGGITDFAAGNRATILRTVDGKPVQFKVKLQNLMRDGDISANVPMLPGDVLIIPESYF
jgi:polysaccharide export outer membrane protein